MTSIEWELFTILAAITLYSGYVTHEPGDKMLRCGFSFIFWIASLSQWISDSGGFVPMLALIAPTMISLVYMVQALGEVTDQPVKKDIYSVY